MVGVYTPQIGGIRGKIVVDTNITGKDLVGFINNKEEDSI